MQRSTKALFTFKSLDLVCYLHTSHKKKVVINVATCWAQKSKGVNHRIEKKKITNLVIPNSTAKSEPSALEAHLVGLYKTSVGFLVLMGV